MKVGKVAESKHHEHQSPLCGADTAHEADGAFVDQARQRQEQEYVDRDKHNKHPVPFDIDPIELERYR